MKKLFCIIGLTGAGKSTFYNYIVKEMEKADVDISPLIYHTTREKRKGEIDGKDYYFVDREEFFHLQEHTDIIEYRQYSTKNNRDVIYFTTKEDISLNGSNNLICTPSIEQLESYIKWNIEDSSDKEFELYVIKIETNMKSRIMRILKNRCSNDNDILELCRRILQETKDWEIEEDVLSNIKPSNYIVIDNNKDSDFITNSKAIINYIETEINILE